jgi:hypothetical protein
MEQQEQISFSLQTLMQDYQEDIINKSIVVNTLKSLFYGLSQHKLTVFYAKDNFCLLENNEQALNFEPKEVKGAGRPRTNYILSNIKVNNPEKYVQFVTAIYFLADTQNANGNTTKPRQFFIDTEIFVESVNGGKAHSFFASQISGLNQFLRPSADIPVRYTRPTIEIDDYNTKPGYKEEQLPPQENAKKLPKSIRFRNVSQNMQDDVGPKNEVSPWRKKKQRAKIDQNAKQATTELTDDEMRFRDYPIKKTGEVKPSSWNEPNWEDDEWRKRHDEDWRVTYRESREAKVNVRR